MNKLKRAAAELGIQLSSFQLDQFWKYQQLIEEFNQYSSLTSIKPGQIWRELFLNSLLIITVVDLLSNKTLVDIGTGAGIPALPLKIALPSLNITLVESQKRKQFFLKEVIAKLNLRQVQLLPDRAETVGRLKKYRENFDLAISRAVADLPVVLEYSLPLVKIGGKVIIQTSGKSSLKIAKASKISQLLGGEALETKEICLKGKVQQVIVASKSRHTDSGFPRRVGLPQKKPLSVPLEEKHEK